MQIKICTNLNIFVEYIINFRNALRKVDFESLITERNPDVPEYSSKGYYGYGTTLLKPPKKTRDKIIKTGQWTDWNDHYYDLQKDEDEQREEDWDDLGPKSPEKKGIHELSDDEWEELQIDSITDDKLDEDDSKNDIDKFFNDRKEYQKWLDDEFEIKQDEIQERNFKPDERADDEYDWDSWFKGFI